jgi:hypothetical protein
MTTKKPDTYFVVTFKNADDNKTQTLRVRSLTDSTLGLTFIALSDFVFDSDSPIIDPQEDNLRRKFANTRKLHLSIYSVVSVEEVGFKGRSLSLKHKRSNVVALKTLPRPTRD